MRKIPVNAGLGCPNRDGTCGRGGCIFCNNDAFTPGYAASSGLSITDQLAAGIEFARKKGPFKGYLAYFQSYSNTYGKTAHLIELYEEALRYPGVVGLVIATRPDCLAPDLMDYFETRFGSKAPAGHPYLLVELGIESTEDRTLETIRRGHDFECSSSAVTALARIGIAVGAHIILGLPGETETDFVKHAERLSDLPLTTLKLHHLQIVRGTGLEEMYHEGTGDIRLMTPESYAAAVTGFVAHLRKDIVLDRFVSEMPPSMVVAPNWGLKPSEFMTILDRNRKNVLEALD